MTFQSFPCQSILLCFNSSCLFQATRDVGPSSSDALDGSQALSQSHPALTELSTATSGIGDELTSSDEEEEEEDVNRKTSGVARSLSRLIDDVAAAVVASNQYDNLGMTDEDKLAVRGKVVILQNGECCECTHSSI